MPEEDIPDGAGEIDPVGADRVFEFLLQVAPLRVDDLFQCFGHICIIGRHQSGFEADAQRPDVVWVEAEIVFAERPHAKDLDVAAQIVDELRQFVDPEAAEEPAPGGDAKIVLELAGLVELVVAIDPVLDEFGIGVHGAQLVECKDPALVTDPLQAHQRTVGGIAFRVRTFVFLRDAKELRIDHFGGQDAKAAEIEAAEQLGFGESAVVAAPQGEIELVRSGQFGHDPVHEKIERIEEAGHVFGVFVVQGVQPFLKGVQNHDKITAVHQLLLREEKIGIDAAEIIDPVQVDQHVQRAVVDDLNVVERMGVEHRQSGFGDLGKIAMAVEQREKRRHGLQIVALQPIARGCIVPL